MDRGGVAGGRGRHGRGRGGGGRGGGSGKDAFDNAGNWGDDFPQADDWDNEVRIIILLFSELI